MDDSEDCTTCGVYMSRKRRRRTFTCLIRRERLKKICPCMTCIVKTICYSNSGDDCEEHAQLYEYAHKKKNKRLVKW